MEHEISLRELLMREGDLVKSLNHNKNEQDILRRDLDQLVETRARIKDDLAKVRAELKKHISELYQEGEEDDAQPSST